MKLVKLRDLFQISYGTNLSLNKCKIKSDGIPFVSRTEKNNGVAAKVDLIYGVPTVPRHTLSVALGGSVLETFYQPEDYYTGYHVFVLNPKMEISEKEMLAYSVAIKANSYKYNYGRQANRTLPDILVPGREEILRICTDIHFPEQPSNMCWSESYRNILLQTGDWGEFKFSHLFGIKKGKMLSKGQRGVTTPYISSTKYNNGCSKKINYVPCHPGNTITVSSNGSIAEAFYQPIPFCASGDVNVLYPKFELNEFIAMFLVTIIGKEKYRFNYGRKWNSNMIKEDTIKLPMNMKREPDWNQIEDYIKSLPFSYNLGHNKPKQVQTETLPKNHFSI